MASAEQVSPEFVNEREDHATRAYIEQMLADGWSLVGRAPLLLQRGHLQATYAANR